MKLYLKRFRSLIELLETFPTDESCIIYLENILWHNKVISPFDKKSQVYHLGNHRYMCKNTKRVFHLYSYQEIYKSLKRQLGICCRKSEPVLYVEIRES